MPTDTPATDRLAAKLKAARSLGQYTIDITPTHAQEIITEARRLADCIQAVLADLEHRAETVPNTTESCALTDAIRVIEKELAKTKVSA